MFNFILSYLFSPSIVVDSDCMTTVDFYRLEPVITGECNQFTYFGEKYIISELMSGSNTSGGLYNIANYTYMTRNFNRIDNIINIEGDNGIYGIGIHSNLLLNNDIFNVVSKLETIKVLDESIADKIYRKWVNKCIYNFVSKHMSNDHKCWDKDDCLYTVYKVIKNYGIEINIRYKDVFIDYNEIRRYL